MSSNFFGRDPHKPGLQEALGVQILCKLLQRTGVNIFVNKEYNFQDQRCDLWVAKCDQIMVQNNLFSMTNRYTIEGFCYLNRKMDRHPITLSITRPASVL